jgi:hypothetical protein
MPMKGACRAAVRFGATRLDDIEDVVVRVVPEQSPRSGDGPVVRHLSGSVHAATYDLDTTTL